MPSLLDLLQKGALSGQQNQPQQGALQGVLSSLSMPPARPQGAEFERLSKKRMELMNQLPQYNPEVRWALETSKIFMNSRGQKQEWEALQHRLNMKEQELDGLNAILGK